MRKKKYSPGRTITNILHLTLHIEEKRWIYMWDKPKHPAFISHFPLHSIMYFLEKGAFRVAHLTHLNKEKEDSNGKHS